MLAPFQLAILSSASSLAPVGGEFDQILEKKQVDIDASRLYVQDIPD